MRPRPSPRSAALSCRRPAALPRATPPRRRPAPRRARLRRRARRRLPPRRRHQRGATTPAPSLRRLSPRPRATCSCKTLGWLHRERPRRRGDQPAHRLYRSRVRRRGGVVARASRCSSTRAGRRRRPPPRRRALTSALATPARSTPATTSRTSTSRATAWRATARAAAPTTASARDEPQPRACATPRLPALADALSAHD